MKNKFAKFSNGNAAGALAFTFLFGPLGIIFGILAIIFGIKGLKAFQQDPTIGGKAWAIAGIIIGSLVIIMQVLVLIAQATTPAIPSNRFLF